MTATAPNTATTTTWTIDPAHSNIDFAVKHLMIATVKGNFGAVSGTVTFDESTPANTRVEAEIETGSITTRADQRDTHLRSPDFFDVEKYPTMRFRSSRVEKTGDGEFRLTGDLTIRDVTKPVTLTVTDEGRARDPWGGERAVFSAKGKISRGDYGLSWNQALEAGGVLVGDEIKISIDVELVKKA
jgi:polyisoprenoid-binding protein YceI